MSDKMALVIGGPGQRANRMQQLEAPELAKVDGGLGPLAAFFVVKAVAAGVAAVGGAIAYGASRVLRNRGRRR